MSKPVSGLFHGTKGERFHAGDAEAVIAERTVGLDLREHPLQNWQLSAKQVNDCQSYGHARGIRGIHVAASLQQEA